MSRPTLLLGSTGAAVKALQRALTQAGYSLVEDGNFGPLTQEAVKNLQRTSSLSVDGVVGAATWVALENRLGVSLDVPDVPAPASRTQAGTQQANPASSSGGSTVAMVGAGLLVTGLAAAAWWKWGRR